MTKRLLLGLAIAAAMLGVGVRALQLLALPVGTGETRVSPDGRHEATVYDWADESFWGAKRSWFSYEIREVASARMVERFTSDRLRSPYFGSRSSHRVIAWAPDSTSVRFIFTDVEITVRVSR